MFHINHGPISYRFRDKRRLQSKTAKFSHPFVFCAPAEGVPLELGIDAGSEKKTRMTRTTGPNKKFDDIFSHLDTIHQRDGQRATAKTALIASRGKKIIAASTTPPALTKIFVTQMLTRDLFAIANLPGLKLLLFRLISKNLPQRHHWGRFSRML